MKEKLYSLSDLRNTTLCLLALCFKQRFPRAHLLGGSITPQGFYYDFSLDSPFSSKDLALVEEVMEAWIRQKIEVQLREMVAVSAREYFFFHKEPSLVKFIEESSSPTFFFLQIAGQMVLSNTSDHLSSLGEIKAFCLKEVERIGEKLRVHGSCFFDKKELKEFLKLSKDQVHFSHIVLGKKLKLFEEDQRFLWLPRGKRLYSILEKRIEEEEESFGFQRVSSGVVFEDSDELLFFHKKIFEMSKQSTGRFSEKVSVFLEQKDSLSGLLNTDFYQGIQSHVFCAKKDLLSELISSLHFMTKIFKILDFAFQIVLFEVRKGKFKEVSSFFSKALDTLGLSKEAITASEGKPRIEFKVADGLGQTWPIAFIEPGSATIESEAFLFSPCISIERMIALLLEKTKGVLPFWLTSLQIVIIPLQQRHLSFAEETLNQIKKEGFRADVLPPGLDLKEELSSLFESGIPFALILGDREIEDKKMTIRNLRLKTSQSLPWQELVEYLKKVN